MQRNKLLILCGQLIIFGAEPRDFLRMGFFIAGYLPAKISFDLFCCHYLVADKFNMPPHLRRLGTVKNKLVNSVQVLCQFHG
jgi:hypothetical protein